MRRNALLVLMAALGALPASSLPASAERLVASLSNHRVMVTSNFTGEELVLFGGVEQDATSRPRRSTYDIVVTVTGPRQDVVTFRKSRVLGIWVNADSRTFDNVPAYLAVLSNRPLDAVTSAETLRRLQLGLDNTPLPQRASVNIADAATDDPFRLALISAKTKSGLYREVANGVTFLTPALFRASIPLPAEVPVGTYEVDVRLFADARADRARTVSVRSVQVRLRAGHDQCGPRPRPALRPRHRDDGHRYRLARRRGLPARLIRGPHRPGNDQSGGSGMSRPNRHAGSPARTR